MIPKFVDYSKEFRIFFFFSESWVKATERSSYKCQEQSPKTESLGKKVGNYSGC